MNFLSLPVAEQSLTSIMGLCYLAITLSIGVGIGYGYRKILTHYAKSKIRKYAHNIGIADRVFRLLISLGILIWALSSNWSPYLLIFSGFTAFEAFGSWCAVYAAAGVSTCSVK